MVKLVVAGAIVVAYVLHPHGASAAKVVGCPFDIAPRSHGKVVMLWFGGSAAESRAVVEGCF